MMALSELRTELERIIRYESVFRTVDTNELNRYINHAYRDLAAWSYALISLQTYQVGGGPDDYPHQVRINRNGLIGQVLDFQPVGLIAPYHLMWHRGTVRISLRPALYIRPEILLENADRARGAPTPIDEYPAPVPNTRFLPQHKLVQEEYEHPHEFVFHNGFCLLRPAPRIISGNAGQLWVYGAFVPMPIGSVPPAFPILINDSDLCRLPILLAQHLPDVAYYYYARAITDLYPVAVQRYQAARELALYYRQQLIQDAIQGIPFDQNSSQPDRRKR